MSSFSRWCSEDVKPIPPTLPCVPLRPTLVSSKVAPLPVNRSTSSQSPHLMRVPIPISFTPQRQLHCLDRRKTSETHGLDQSILGKTAQAKNLPESRYMLPETGSLRNKSSSFKVSNESNDIFLTPISGLQKLSTTSEKRATNCSIISSGKISPCLSGSSATAKVIIVHHGSKLNSNGPKKSNNVKCTIVPSKSKPAHISCTTGGPNISFIPIKNYLGTAGCYNEVSKSNHSTGMLSSSYKGCKSNNNIAAQICEKSKACSGNSKFETSQMHSLLNQGQSPLANHVSKGAVVPSAEGPITFNNQRILSAEGKHSGSSNARRNFQKLGSSSFDEEDTEVEDFLSPSDRWAVQPKSYRGPRRETMLAPNRRAIRRVVDAQYPDATTTDGETSGMGSSLDELVESSTESASESSCSVAVVNPSHSVQLHLGPHSSRSFACVSENSSRTSSFGYRSKSPLYCQGSSSSKKSFHSSPSINLDVAHSSHHEKSSILFAPSSSSNLDHHLSHPIDQHSGNTSQQMLSSLRCKLRTNPLRADVPFSFSGGPFDTAQGLASSATLPKCPPVKRRGGWPKGRKRKPEIPGAKPPKAPQTAYVLFLADRRKFYDPREYTFGEITKRVAMEWNSLPQPQRDVYERRCEQEKNRYRSELQAYRQSHDFQLIMRKKRLKRALSGGNPEDSSDCTDGPEEDGPEELYCSKCDKLFSSLHNKRLHLYGRPHNRAQPARKARPTTSQSCSLTDYNTDNNTDYDDSSAAPSSSLYSYALPHYRSSTTSPSTSPFPPTVSSPGTSVAATSASEDEEIPADGGTKRDRRHETRYGECGVASIAEEGNDGDLEDGAEDDEAPANQPVGASLAALRAKLAAREKEIRELRMAKQESDKERVLLQQTLELERQRMNECNAAWNETLASYSQTCRNALALWTSVAALAAPGTVDNPILLAYQTKADAGQPVDDSTSGDVGPIGISSCQLSVDEPQDTHQTNDFSQLKNGFYAIKADIPEMLDDSCLKREKNDAHYSHDVSYISKGIACKVESCSESNNIITQMKNEVGHWNADTYQRNIHSFQGNGKDTRRKGEGSQMKNKHCISGFIIENSTSVLRTDETMRYSNGPLMNDYSTKKNCVQVVTKHRVESYDIGASRSQCEHVPRLSIKNSSVQHDRFEPKPAPSSVLGSEKQVHEEFLPSLHVPLEFPSATTSSLFKDGVVSFNSHVTESVHVVNTNDANGSRTRTPCNSEPIFIELCDESILLSPDTLSPTCTESSKMNHKSREKSYAVLDCKTKSGEQLDDVLSTATLPKLSEDSHCQFVPLLDHDYASYYSSSPNIPLIVTTASSGASFSGQTSTLSAISSSFESKPRCNDPAVAASKKITLFNETVANEKDFPWSSVEEACQEICKVAKDSKSTTEATSDSLVKDSNQEITYSLDSVNVQSHDDMKSPSSVRNLGLVKTALNDPIEESPALSTLSWFTPNKKTTDYSNIDSDSSTDFLSYAAYNSGLSDYVYSTDTEDCCSDSMSTNATFNKLSLVDSLIEENDSRDQFSFQPEFSNVSPGRFFEDDFRLSHDNELMDLNELLGRCLHNENFPEVTTTAPFGSSPQAEFSRVDSLSTRATHVSWSETTDRVRSINNDSLISMSPDKNNIIPTLSSPCTVFSPSTSLSVFSSTTEHRLSPLRSEEPMDVFL